MARGRIAGQRKRQNVARRFLPRRTPHTMAAAADAMSAGACVPGTARMKSAASASRRSVRPLSTCPPALFHRGNSRAAPAKSPALTRRNSVDRLKLPMPQLKTKLTSAANWLSFTSRVRTAPTSRHRLIRSARSSASACASVSPPGYSAKARALFSGPRRKSLPTRIACPQPIVQMPTGSRYGCRLTVDGSPSRMPSKFLISSRPAWLISRMIGTSLRADYNHSPAFQRRGDRTISCSVPCRIDLHQAADHRLRRGHPSAGRPSV